MTNAAARPATRPDLPVVLGGSSTAGSAARSVPIRSVLGSPAGHSGRGRHSIRWWGTVAWCAAVLACATSAFAIRDTMFPRLGRTEAPSAWQAPTRPPASIPYDEREGGVPTGTSLPAAAAAASGTPLQLDVADSNSATDHDDDSDSTTATAIDEATTATAVTGARDTKATLVLNPPAPDASPPPPSTSPDSSMPSTTESAPTTSAPDDTLPDDGTSGGNGRGRGSGGASGDTVP